MDLKSFLSDVDRSLDWAELAQMSELRLSPDPRKIKEWGEGRMFEQIRSNCLGNERPFRCETKKNSKSISSQK